MTDQARRMAEHIASLQAASDDDLRCIQLLMRFGWRATEINQHFDAAKAEAERISKGEA